MAAEKEPKVIAVDAILDRAEDCLVLAKSHHEQAELQHQGASRQILNADAQKGMACLQHRNADTLEAKAKTLENQGHSLEADAAKISGKT